MYPKTHQKPVRGAGSRRTEKKPKRNTTVPEARTEKTATSEKAENMAQEQATKDYVDAAINGVRTEIAQGFGDVNTAIAQGFGDVNTAIAKIGAENAERIAKVETGLTDKIVKVETGLTDKIASVETSLTREIGDKTNAKNKWVIATTITALGVLVGVISIILMLFLS